MKILMVATSYPRFEGDAAAIFLRRLAVALAARGEQIEVLAPADARADGSLRDPGVRVHRFRYPAFPGGPLAYGSGILPNLRAHPLRVVQLPFFLLAMFFALLVRVRRVRPDLIHAHWVLPGGVLAVLAGRMLGVPVLVTAHGGDAFSFRRGAGRWLKRFALRRADRVSANTRATARALAQSWPGIEARVVPMGVDCARFGQVARKPQAGEGPVVLFVGRLVKKKGVEVLLRAWQRCQSEWALGGCLWIVGDGGESTALERLAEGPGLAGRVRFFGRLPNEALPEIYAAADVFVAPSVVDEWGDTEGQGVVLIEAMAAGVPVVASAVGGICDVIRDGEHGWLVPPDDAGKLAQRIHEVLELDPAQRAGVVRQAGERVRKRYDWPVVAGQFSALYREVAGSA